MELQIGELGEAVLPKERAPVRERGVPTHLVAVHVDLRTLDDPEDHVTGEAVSRDIILDERVDLDEVVSLSLVVLDQALPDP